MQCETLDPRLAASCDDPDAMEPDVSEHVESCLRCQAELVHYRRLRSELSELEGGALPATDGLLNEILTGLDRSVTRRSHLRRARRVTCTLAAAAGTVGAVVIVGRVRHRRPML